jgi:hypothetical protein
MSNRIPPCLSESTMPFLPCHFKSLGTGGMDSNSTLPLITFMNSNKPLNFILSLSLVTCKLVTTPILRTGENIKRTI